jgi:high-affinity iron transporter
VQWAPKTSYVIIRSVLKFDKRTRLPKGDVDLLFTSVVAALTFVAHRKLPYKKMLVLTGIMLGAVLMIMVGEQAQEMQLAHWLPTTRIPWLTNIIPAWMGLWFSVFPTLQTLAAQAVAGVLVIGSYFVARR